MSDASATAPSPRLSTGGPWLAGGAIAAGAAGGALFGRTAWDNLAFFFAERLIPAFEELMANGLMALCG